MIYLCNCLEQKKPEYFFIVLGFLEPLNLSNYIHFFAPITNNIDRFFWLQN